MGPADRFTRALQRAGSKPALLPGVDRKSSVAPFTSGPLTFECWIVPCGPNEEGLPTTRYVWRTADQRYSCGRNVGKFWATCGTKPVGGEFDTPGAAMRACGLHAAKARP